LGIAVSPAGRGWCPALGASLFGRKGFSGSAREDAAGFTMTKEWQEMFNRRFTEAV
jgi:hypothetical protein